MTSHRAPTVDRGEGRSFRLTARDTDACLVCSMQNKVDVSASFTSIHPDLTPNEGDARCASTALLSEAAFDALGAARFLEAGNVGFAKQAVASALAELTVVAARLGVA